jgi:predicted amino acid dehydrogenase
LILGEDYKKIILIDLERKLQSVHDAFIERGGKPDHIEINHRISAVREADIIITVTNAPEAVVEDEDIRPGAIIIDDAQPSDISPEIIANRKDIIVIEAGVISAKEHIRVGTNFRLANPHEVYCCLCEAMAIAASGWDAKYEPRKITPELVSQIRSITAQMGFTLAPYQAYGRIIPEEQIDTVKNIVRKRLYNL